MSRRQQIKAQRVKKQRNNRLILGIIILAALVLFGLLVLPNLLPKPTIERPNAIGMAMGDPNAPVKIEQFSDFRCSHCADYSINMEPDIIKQYIATGKVYMKYMPFALLGPASNLAAEAAYCANDQGKFWQFHDILFANQVNYTTANLVKFAGEAKADTKTFQTCLESGQYKQKVLDDAAYATSKKVEGTPSFMVNTRLVYSNELKGAFELELANTVK